MKIAKLVQAALVSLFVVAGAQAQTEKTKLTNAKVIEMIKAGLDDDNIVKAIQQSSGGFDSSPDALIELKKQGASKKVVDAIQEAAKPSPHKTSQVATSQPELAPFTVTLVDGEKRTLMQKASGDMKAGGMVAAPWSPHKVRMAFNGAQSTFRITTSTPVFEIALPADVRASERIALLQPEIKSKKMRQIETMRAQVFVGTQKAQNVTIPLSIDKIRDQSSAGTQLIVYRIKPAAAVSPGEYVLAVQTYNQYVIDYYDFGVDLAK